MRYILLLAFIPIFVIAVYIYKRDKFNKEPLKELLKAFAAGMLTNRRKPYIMIPS